ncbi:hypothetical protein [Vibrio phage vB_VmeM-Yong XC32]|nr:hypothetical protein [Vibrio phage vB_VmeM-Yong XC31]QAX96514.1 hypothetical protein [Vibrio phage vB_VmeM-Yong XC32]QAX96831.1 hypothetical protein [Vibrio phage vB_VmeM-Yong MS31]
MVKTVVGRIRGDKYNGHDVSQAYKKLDEVYDDGKAYVCKQDVAENSNTPLSDETKWQLFATFTTYGTYFTHDSNRAYVDGDQVWIDNKVYVAIDDIPADSDIPLTDDTKWEVRLTGGAESLPVELRHAIDFRTVDEDLRQLSENLLMAAPTKPPRLPGLIKVCPSLSKRYISVGTTAASDWEEF